MNYTCTYEKKKCQAGLPQQQMPITVVPGIYLAQGTGPEGHIVVLVFTKIMG